MDELEAIRIWDEATESSEGLATAPHGEVEAAALAAAEAEDEATPLERLAAGNRRLRAAFAASPDPVAVLAALSRAQPYAIILGCSDSRVPPEIIFDETHGRLFVVRVASNLAGPTEIGSIEYALARWSCPLLVVLGHSQCGGVAAAMDRLPEGAEPPPSTAGSMHMGSLVAGIKSNLGYTGALAYAPDPWLAAVQLNVRKTVETLTNWSEPIRRRLAAGELKVVPAVYRVESGEVEFMDQPPGS